MSDRERSAAASDLDHLAVMNLLANPSLGDLEGISPEHDLAPWAAFLDVRNGETARGMALALSLRAEPLDLTGDNVNRVCDLVANRLWLARIEFRPDAEASAVARALLAEDHPLGSYRRALLHYALGADLLTHTPGSRALNESNEHLNRALGLARSLEVPTFVARCQAMLALLQVPRGNLVVAEELCHEALSTVPINGPVNGPLPFWQLRALLVLQWARHYQGKQVDVEAVRRCTARSLVWSDPILAAHLATVTALAALEAGDVAAARRALGQVEADRRINGIGIWRLPVLVVGAYLSVTRADPQQTERLLADIEQVPAPAEAALIRAVHLSHAGRGSEALMALTAVTSGAVRAVAITFTSASALEAALFEALGRHDDADRSMARALGAAEPINALRVFTQQGPENLKTLARRAAEAAPLNRWIATVATYLEDFAATPGDHAYEEPVRTDLDISANPTSTGIIAVGADGDAISPLTPRELEVLKLVNEGASYEQIASRLFVSQNTAKSHLRSIRGKLGVRRTAEAAAVARRAGWL